MTHSKSHRRIGRMVLVGITTLFSTVALAQQPSSTDESTQDESTQAPTERAPIPASASTLVVESPVLAEVFVDNQPAGQTPLTLSIEPGKHTVRISADGFDPFVRRVTVIDGQTAQLTADLMDGGGTVEFQASVSPATLILDDGEMILPIRLNELSEGTHKWEIRATGYETAKGQFTLVNGKNVFIYEMLDSSLGK